MRRSLHLQIGNNFSKVIPLKNGKYSIGRTEDSAIQIESMQVSRHHADILVSESSVMVQDCGSANGTIVNGVPVKERVLEPGDEVAIGQAILKYALKETEDETNLRRATMIRPQPKSETGLYARTIRLKYLVLGTILLPSLLGLSFMAVSFHRAISENTLEESLKRGQDLVVQLALENRELLRMGNELLLNVEDITREPGVLKAFIYNAKGRVLAPLGTKDGEEIDPFVTEALSQTSARRLLPSPPFADGTRVMVHPIRVFDSKDGKYQTIGAAKIIYDPSEGRTSPIPTMTIIIVCFLVTLLLALAAAFWLAKKLIEPISKLADQVDQWRYGHENIDVHTPFHEWQGLYRSLIKWMEDRRR